MTPKSKACLVDRSVDVGFQADALSFAFSTLRGADPRLTEKREMGLWSPADRQKGSAYDDAVVRGHYGVDFLVEARASGPWVPRSWSSGIDVDYSEVFSVHPRNSVEVAADVQLRAVEDERRH